MRIIYNITFIAMALILLTSLSSAIEDTIDLDDYELTYSYSASDVVASEKFSLRITIHNTGSEKSNVELNLDPDSIFDIDDEDWDIGTLLADSNVSKTFRIDVDEDAMQGDYDIDFTLCDDDDDFDDTIEIEVESDSLELVIADIERTPSDISPQLKDIE